MCSLYNLLIGITIDIIFFSMNWKNYFDLLILVISMTALPLRQPDGFNYVVFFFFCKHKKGNY